MRAVLLITVLATALHGAEPIATTSWDVRRSAKELIEDLEHHRGEDSVLIERAQTLMAEHGTELIDVGKPASPPGAQPVPVTTDDSWNPSVSGSAPISVVITAKLKQVGLEDAFIASFQPIANRKLEELGAHPASAGLQALARGFPGTQAAHQAWLLLADHAWDAGQLNAFIEFANLAGDAALAGDAPRHQRLQAALTLLGPAAHPELPPSFDGITEIWRLPIEQHRVAPRPNQGDALAPQSLAIAATPGEAAAISDGVRLLVVDHLIGRLEGVAHRLGDQPLSPRQCRPLPVPDGFVALGSEKNQLLLVCVDRNGNERWRYQSGIRGNEGAQQLSGLSSLVLLDHLVVVATSSMQEDGLNLQVHAIDAQTGVLAWTAEVARLPASRRQTMLGDSTNPSLCVQAGGLLLLSNNGMLARVGADGSVERIWGYPSTIEDMNAGLAPLSRVDRQGAIISDGDTAVITPSDNAGLTLLVHGTQDPEVYRGDGAGGDVLAVDNGVAVLAARFLTCIDLATKTKRWDLKMRTALVNPQAVIGSSDVMMFSNNDLMLVSLKDGSVVAERTFEPRTNLLVVDQTLLFGGPDFVAAYGGSASTLDKIAEAAKADPTDYRPRARLAGLLQARGDALAAFNAYIEALRLGAPADYAERAARGVRERLDLAIGDAKSFKEAIAQLETLAGFDPTLAHECLWWRGRDAEIRTSAAEAAAFYQQAAASPPRLIQLHDGLLCDLTMLAHAGLNRLKLEPGTQPLGAEPDSPLPDPRVAWSAPGTHARPSLIAGGMLVGYADGFLTARHVADGAPGWSRRPRSPKLGIRNTPQPAGPIGVEIEVLAGTSADAAGMKTGDILLTFNGKDIHTFAGDLIPLVTSMAPRAAFTAVVQRADQKVTVTGALGGDPVEPLAANDRTVLVEPVGLGNNVPQGVFIEALDLATGAPVFEPPTQPPTGVNGQGPQPLLTSDDKLIIADGDDLVGLQVHALPGQAAGNQLWRHAGDARELDHCSLVGSHLLWFADPDRGRGELVEARSGAVMASLPSEGDSPPLIDGYDAFPRQADYTVSCFDLGSGRQRWRTSQAVSSVLAARGDAVYVILESGDLAILDRVSGAIRRRLGEWSSVIREGISGDLLYLSVRVHDADAIAVLSLATGTTLWTQVLPAQTEVQSVWTSASGILLHLHESEAGWMLQIGADGRILGVASTPIDGEHEFEPLAHGVLDIGRDSERVLPMSMPSPPSALRTIAVDPGLALPEAGAAALPRLQWQDCGGGSQIAVAWSGSGLLVFAKGEPELTVHFGDAGSLIDSSGSLLSFSPSDGTARFVHGTSDWHLTGQMRVGSDQGQMVARLDPPLDRPASLPLLLRASAVEQPETTPVWLTSTWQLVERPSPPQAAPAHPGK